MTRKFSYEEEPIEPELGEVSYDYILSLMKCTLPDVTMRSVLREVACVFYRSEFGDTHVCNNGDYTVSEVPINNILDEIVESEGKSIKEVYSIFHTHPYPIPITYLNKDLTQLISESVFNSKDSFERFFALSVVYADQELLPYFSVQDILAGTRLFVEEIYGSAQYFGSKIRTGVIALGWYDIENNKIIVKMVSPNDVIEKLGEGNYDRAIAKLKELWKEENNITMEMGSKLHDVYQKLVQAKREGNKQEIDRLADEAIKVVRSYISPGKKMYNLRVYLDIVAGVKKYTLDADEVKSECGLKW